MLLERLVEVSDSVSTTRSRTEKVTLLADFLGDLGEDEAAAAVSYLTGQPLQKRLGAGYATVYGVAVDAAASPSLTITEVDQALAELSAVSGAGSKKRRDEILAELLGRATLAEQDFLRNLMLRNLRQGALEGVMAEAVASAIGAPAELVRRAAMLNGDLISTAVDAINIGPSSLQSAALRLFTPLQPMLAATAPSASDAVESLGRAFVEQKLDGLRVQVHRSGSKVEVFSRNLRPITSSMPRVIRRALELDAGSFILDGEALLLSDEGEPMSFQDSMSGKSTSSHHELASFYFDILHLNGSDLLDEPLVVRRARLTELLPSEHVVDALLTDQPGRAEEFFDASVAAGFEGVVVKDPDQAYEAGRRGSGWLKVKPTHTLDLVVLAAEWGSGRRQGWLSNLHLGARDPDGGYVMLGKTFKGLTDQMLAWQTEEFLQLETRRSGHVVFLEPAIVYEIAFDGVQRSTRYPGGVALRFARVKRYREDKTPEDADTIDTVRSYL